MPHEIPKGLLAGKCFWCKKAIYYSVPDTVDLHVETGDYYCDNSMHTYATRTVSQDLLDERQQQQERETYKRSRDPLYEGEQG